MCAPSQRRMRRRERANGLRPGICPPRVPFSPDCDGAIVVMPFSGFAQVFVTWLIHVTGTPIAHAYYLMFRAAVGLVAVLFLKERVRGAEMPIGDTFEPT